MRGRRLPSSAATVALLGCNAIAGIDPATLREDATVVDDSHAATDLGVDATETATSYRDLVMSDGPVAYWRLGEASGTNAKDEAGKNDGTYHGGYVLGTSGAIAGDANTAASFDGTSACITISDVFELVGETPFSLEVWMKVTSIDSSNYIRILGKDNPSDSDGYDLIVHGTAPTQLLFERWKSGADDVAQYSLVSLGGWHHVVATYDGATMRLYVDALSVGSTPSTRAVGATSGSTLALGCELGGSNFFHGALDEIAIYDKALTPARISAHAAAGAGP